MSDGASLTFSDTKAGRVQKARAIKYTRLRKARPRVTQELFKALVRAGEEHAGFSRVIVRKDTMDLHDSIEVVASFHKINPSVSVVAGPDDFPAKAIFEEFGTAPHKQGGQFAGTSHPGTSANPFMYGPYNFLKKKNLGRISRGISKGIKQGVK